MTLPTRLGRAFVATALATVLLGAAGAHAQPAGDATAFARALDATGVLPTACVELLVERLVAAPSPGTPLPRLYTLAGAEAERIETLVARLAKAGLPVSDYTGRIVRLPAQLEPTRREWLPTNMNRAQPNRGYALLTFEGSTLLVVDHMDSPVTAVTTVWQDDGQRMRQRAEFPGEIASFEDGPDRIRLHLDDAVTAAHVSWDKAESAFIGGCVIGYVGIGFTAEATPEVVLARAPRAFALAPGKRASLALLPAPDDANRVAQLPAGTRGIALFARADGWTLVLVPWVDRTARTALFRPKVTRKGATLGRTWQLGWLAPGSVPAAP